jgi:hypothetical protein
MEFPGEVPNVLQERFVWLLPATLQVLEVVGSHIGALGVASEDLLEILPTIDHVSHKVIQLGPRQVDQVDEEELDDE